MKLRHYIMYKKLKYWKNRLKGAFIKTDTILLITYF